MAESNSSPDRVPPPFTISLSKGRVLSCPTYPQPCSWVAVGADGVEIHRSTDRAVAADPLAKLTRLAEALDPGRPQRPDLPQPADQDPYDWRECAAAADSGRTIRFEPAPGQTDYVRVCDRDGTELGYWDSAEFEEDAADCLGAAVGALAGGDR